MYSNEQMSKVAVASMKNLENTITSTEAGLGVMRRFTPGLKLSPDMSRETICVTVNDSESAVKYTLH